MRAPHSVHKTMWKAIWVIVAGALLLCTAPTSALLADGGDEQEANLREKRYYYNAFNRRDPFQSLIVGEFEHAQAELVDINSVRLVGVLSGGAEKFAMLEDKSGFAYILRAGDPVRNGSVVSIRDRSLVARITMFGQTNSVTLHLEGSEKTKGES